MEVRLDGRTALITGGSLGLGKAMAMMFADSGAKVAIIARRLAVLDETKKEIDDTTGGTVGAYCCNVLEQSEIAAAHAAADVFRIMISSDNHLGYQEKDPVRGEDSVVAFAEVLS